MIMDEWIAYLRNEKGFSLLTIRNYAHDLDEFIRFFLKKRKEKEFDAASVVAEDVREWIVYLVDSGHMAPASVNRAVYSLHSYFRFLRLKGIVDNDFMARVGTLRAPRPLPAYVEASKAEAVLHRLFAVPRDATYRVRRDRMIVLLFYALGIRLAELVGMNTDDFGRDMRLVKIRGKGDKQRVIPIVDRIREEIVYFMKKNSEENICDSAGNALFLSMKGRRISRTEVYRVVRRFLSESGVDGKCSPHVLRHTFATQLMNSGVDMRQIQELMGHSSLSSTQIYTHSSIVSLKEVYSHAHPRGGE